MTIYSDNTVQFDADLLKKYDTFGPRYTSYPTALQFSPSFSEQNYREEIEQSNRDGSPLSLYFHIPFCESLCFYCACNKIITHTHDRAIPYLKRLHKEISLQGKLIDGSRPVNQLHFGGGTPTFLSDEQLNQLMQVTAKHFELAPKHEREFSIEVDPRAVRENTINLLRDFGFNRISLGVQDFDSKVQKAVNREQSVEQTQKVVDAARTSSYQSVSMDLIYGLPFQTVESFRNTLNTVIAMGPERVAVYNYAHLPHRVKAQKLIKEEDLPDAITKLELLELTINQLQEAGYVYIGMDHFALPDDELVLAKENGSLQRNFQGYSTHADADMIGMGVTSIGKTTNSYSQNERFEQGYFDAIDNDHLAVFQGYRLNEDDLLRRKVIQDLMCHGVIDFAGIDEQFAIDFQTYFSHELEQLKIMTDDGLIIASDREIRVEALGRLLLRNIAMVFDVYSKLSLKQQFSRAI
jgi:oxygen-independent coproporphyrinogen III oxidase